MTNAEIVVRLSRLGRLRRYSAVIVCDGNSLTAGTGGGGQSYPVQLAAAIGSDVLVVNVGIGAQNTPGMISASADVDGWLGGPGVQIVIAWELRNDIHTLGATPVEAVDHMETYCLARRALGAKVLVMNAIQDNYVTSNFSDEEQIAVNAELASRYTAFSSGLIDLAARPELQDPDNVTYFDADKIHLTATGYGIVAATALPFVATREARAAL